MTPSRAPIVTLAALALALAALLAPGCSSTEHARHAADAPSLARLLELMTGTFSSAQQAAADPDNYRDIRLVMTPVWADRADGPWLYVEQAAATSLDKPYRQRVYRITELPSGEFESAVFTLPGDPLRFAGAWRSARPLDDVAPSDLDRRGGCSMFIRAQSRDLYAGSTRGNRCASDLRGARFATSEATITPEGMITWDRGFDENGSQVWGATKAGYRFDRVAAAR